MSQQKRISQRHGSGTRQHAIPQKEDAEEKGIGRREGNVTEWHQKGTWREGKAEGKKKVVTAAKGNVKAEGNVVEGNVMAEGRKGREQKSIMTGTWQSRRECDGREPQGRRECHSVTAPEKGAEQ
jgi:hypothetical protein